MPWRRDRCQANALARRRAPQSRSNHAKAQASPATLIGSALEQIEPQRVRIVIVVVPWVNRRMVPRPERLLERQPLAAVLDDAVVGRQAQRAAELAVWTLDRVAREQTLHELLSGVTLELWLPAQLALNVLFGVEDDPVPWRPCGPVLAPGRAERRGELRHGLRAVPGRGQVSRLGVHAGHCRVVVVLQPQPVAIGEVQRGARGQRG